MVFLLLYLFLLISLDGLVVNRKKVILKWFDVIIFFNFGVYSRILGFLLMEMGWESWLLNLVYKSFW